VDDAPRQRRKPLSKAVRFEVFKRDHFKCQYCGAVAPDVLLHVDHISPVYEGGTDDITNLITACQNCNLGKSKTPLHKNTVLEKSRLQLEILQERREQLELMMEWQRGLRDLDGRKVDELADYWSELVQPFALNETGRATLRKMLKRFALEEIISGMNDAVASYLEVNGDGMPTYESVEKCWQMTCRMSAINQKTANNPDLKRLYYIRAIVRNRLEGRYYDNAKALKWLEAALSWGAELSDLQTIAAAVTSWTAFREELSDLIARLKQGQSEEAG